MQFTLSRPNIPVSFFSHMFNTTRTQHLKEIEGITEPVQAFFNHFMPDELL